jgi:hypothetical protein
MRPRADEVLQSIIWTYDEHILPNVQGDFPKSLALTVSNLLRHVALRMEHEAPALIEDNAEVREVLREVAAYANTLKPAPDSLQALLPKLAAAGEAKAVNGYLSLNDLVVEADALRTLLDDALKALQEHRDALAGDARYQALRDRIRTYLDHQIKRQSIWIREAFTVDRR